MKKALSLLLVSLLLIVSLLPTTIYAAESNELDDRVAAVVQQETINLPDGCVLEVQIFEQFSREANYKNGSKTLTYRNNNGTILWTATLSARFYYDGATSDCVSASLTTHFNDSSYYEVSRSVTREDWTATADFTIGHRVLGVTVSTSSYTLTLSCDMNGNLS